MVGRDTTYSWRKPGHSCEGFSSSDKSTSFFLSDHSDLPDFSGKLTNLTIFLCKLFSQEGREHVAWETVRRSTEFVFNRTNCTLFFTCLSPSSQGGLHLGHSLLGSVKLTFPAEELEDRERQNFSLGRGTLTASTTYKAVKPVLFMATKPWMDLSIPTLETTCPAVNQLGCRVHCRCKTKDETPGSRREAFLVYGIQAGKALPEEIA